MSERAGVWVSSNYEHGMDSVFATEETVSLDTIKAMARAVRDAGFAHQHRFIKGSYYQETSNGLRHMRWDETCRCGESKVRCLTTPVTEGEA